MIGTFLSGNRVEFWVLVDDQPVPTSAKPDDPLAILFRDLRKDPDASKHIPADLAFQECVFFRLSPPVPFTPGNLESGDGFIVKAIASCKDSKRRTRVEPVQTAVKHLVPETFSRGSAYLAIEWLSRKRRRDHPIASCRLNCTTFLASARSAMEELSSRRNSALFKRLRVMVDTLQSWGLSDVEDNLRGGRMTYSIDLLPSVFREVEEALTRKRRYHVRNHIRCATHS